MPKACLHCSTPLTKKQQQQNESFCCRGCESVYHIIHESGQDFFYSLKSNNQLTPLRDKPFQERDWKWLRQLAERDTTPDSPTITLTLGINGLTCIACVWLVESTAKNAPGILSAEIGNNLSSITISANANDDSLINFAQSLHSIGYEISPHIDKKSTHSSLTIRLGICGALAMNTMAFTLPRYTGMKQEHELYQLISWIVIASGTLAFLIGGSYFFKRAWSALRLGGIHMDLPISLGLIFAFIGSCIGWLTGHDELFYFDFVAVFTFLMLLGKYIQNASLQRANAKFQGQTPIPDSYLNNDGQPIPTAEIISNQTLIIPAGSVIPVSSRLCSDQADCSLAWITGEPTSILYKKSDPIPAGAVNQSRNEIIIETTEDNTENHFNKNLTAPERDTTAAQSKFIRLYLIGVLLVGSLAGIYWWFTTRDFSVSLQVVISVFVVSCPCGIGLALPLLDTRFNKFASKIGVFPLTARFWGTLSHISKIVFDKTGTLTLDRPTLHPDTPVENLSLPHQHILFTLTKGSLHPLSRTLFSSLIQAGITHSPHHEQVTETPGVGTFITLETGEIFSLKRAQESTQAPSCALYQDDKCIATFHFLESARQSAASAIASIQSTLPSPCAILSGDNPNSVTKLAKKLGISDAHGGLTPEEKQAAIKSISEKHTTLYIGDGINDLPALRQANLAGAPFANLNLVTEDVDFLFTDETMSYLPRIISMAKIRQRLSHQLILYTILYNVTVVAIAASGHMSPLIAAIIMPLSSIISLMIVSRTPAKLRQLTQTNETE